MLIVFHLKFKYLLPIIVHIRGKQEYMNKNGPYSLILTPYQATKVVIYGICKPYLDAADIKCKCIYETTDIDEQVETLKTDSKW